MKYCSPIDADRKRHLLKLIGFLFDEVLNAGGDADAMWYSVYYDVEDLYPIIEEINSKLKFPWKLSLGGTGINWHDHQQGILITNDEEVYKNSPSWQQILIRY